MAHRFTVWVVATCVVASVAAGAAGTARPAFPSSNGKITFASERDGDFELYLMSADGYDQTRLTTDPADDREPAWSPDGSKLAFASELEIFVMNADGSERTKLTHDRGRRRRVAGLVARRHQDRLHELRRRRRPPRRDLRHERGRLGADEAHPESRSRSRSTWWARAWSSRARRAVRARLPG
jgi:dipeptidyl aminopeptidase/acylaminoacyl peptidase